MITTLLIANRGEIVARIARTARRMGIRTAAVFSDADRSSPALHSVDVAVHLPGVTATETYLDQDAILRAAGAVGADAIHPGFGFLAENATFAEAVIGAGLVWVGPTPPQMAAMGDKVEARSVAAAAGVPVLPSGDIAEADAVGFPLVVKAAAGGGGRGMRIVAGAGDLQAAVAEARGEAERSFSDGTIYVERLVARARHVEVQVFGDGTGDGVHLFERDCSVQRRHQKVIEEAPAPGLDEVTRQALCESALRLVRHIDYRGAGTVEYVVGDDAFWFIEMNTRLQVEHPVTEEVTGIDLVEWQLRTSDGEPIPSTQDDIAMRGHAIEARLYAEDPSQGWSPSVGRIHRYSRGPGPARYEEAIASGSVVTPHYDPMIAKVVVHRPDRREAALALAAELAAVELHGPATNRDFLVAALRSDEFLRGAATTSFVDDHPHLLSPALDQDTQRAHLAAALWARAAGNRDADRHWGFAPAGWRNVPSQPARVTFGATTVDYRLGAGSLEFTAEGDLVAATISGEGPYLVEVGRLARRCATATAEGTIWVNSAEGQSAFSEAPRVVVPDTTLAAGGTTAPVPGTIIEVLAHPGDDVDESDVLVVMEAMKMEHRLRAPGPAVVTDVLVTPGDQVAAGQLLIRLEVRG